MMRIARLFALAGSSLGLVACLDLEHTVTIHDGGAIDYQLRLGLDAKMANGPLAKPKDQRDQEWKDNVPAEAREYAHASVVETPDKVWLVIDANLPDYSSYAEFRDLFVAQYEKDHSPNPVFYPPIIERSGGSLIVHADIPKIDKPFDIPPNAQATWTVIVNADQPITAMGTDPGAMPNAVRWTKPLLDIMRDGTSVSADVHVGYGVWPWLLGGVVVVGIGAGAAVGLRKSA